MKTLAAVLAMLLTLPALCEEAVLVPISAWDVPGVNGSIWRSYLAVANHSDHDVFVSGIEICFLNPCPTPVVPPGGTVFAETFPYWVLVKPEDLPSVRIQLRVQDLSRQAQTWGTTIPTIPESQAISAPRIASLVDIPNSAEFRSMLRIYDFDRTYDPNQPRTKQVRVRYYSITQVQYGLLLDTTYDLVEGSLDPRFVPRMAEIALWTIAELEGVPRLRVEVEAVSEGLRFWAFVSATNNETQHVTILTP